MEESRSEVEVNESFKSPPRRRRSTFFERRESIVPQKILEDVIPNVCTQTQDGSDQNEEDLKRYYDKLVQEKDQWKKEVRERRNKYHDLRQNYEILVKTPGRLRMSYAALSNEDIEFLKRKVNIPNMVKSQLKLHTSVKLSMGLKRKVNELDNIFLSHWEEKLNRIKEYIFENSTIE